MDAPPAKSKLAIFLGLIPLSGQEKRTRRRLIHLVVTTDSLLLLALVVGFSRQWWAVGGAWLVVNIALTGWYFVLIRRAVKHGDLPRWKA